MGSGSIVLEPTTAAFSAKTVAPASMYFEATAYLRQNNPFTKMQLPTIPRDFTYSQGSPAFPHVLSDGEFDLTHLSVLRPISFLVQLGAIKCNFAPPATLCCNLIAILAPYCHHECNVSGMKSAGGKVLKRKFLLEVLHITTST